GYMLGGIRAQAGNFGASTANDTVYRIYITPNNFVGISENEELQNVLLYPNPANDYTDIFYSLKKESPVKLSLYDVTGKEIRKIISGNKVAGRQQIRIDTGS